MTAVVFLKFFLVWNHQVPIFSLGMGIFIIFLGPEIISTRLFGAHNVRRKVGNDTSNIFQRQPIYFWGGNGNELPKLIIKYCGTWGSCAAGPTRLGCTYVALR